MKGETTAMNDPPKLTRVQRLDSIRLDNSYFTEEGYFLDKPIVTSVGIFEYTNPDGSTRRELRLPEHVFRPESLATYKGKPVIVTHSAGRVDKSNVSHEQIGTMLSEGIPDGDDVRCEIIIHDIDEAKHSQLRELSLGYDLVLDETPGEWKGQPYDAIQTEITINHLALVRDARAGEQARLNMDSSQTTLRGGRTNMSKSKAPKTLTAAELSASLLARKKRRLDEAEDPEDTTEENEDSMLTGEIETPEVATEPSDSIDFIRNRRDRRDEDGPPASLEEALTCVLQQDEDIDSLIEMVEALQAQSDFGGTAQDSEDPEATNEDEENSGAAASIQGDSIDTIVRERMKLGRLGDKLRLDGLEDMKPTDAKKAIIRKVNPGMRLDGKSAAYINAAFDIAVNTVNSRKDTDYQLKQMSGRMDGGTAPTGKTSAQKARERMVARQMNGGNE